MKLETQKQKQGQAALIAVLLMLVIMLSAIFGASSVALKEAKVAEENKKSKLSFFAAEAGLEDAVYRLKRGKALGSTVVLSLNGATSNTTVTSSSGRRDIYAEGNLSGDIRTLSSVLLNTTGVSFHYGAQVGEGGLTMGENSKIQGAGGLAGNVYSNGSVTGDNGATVTGDLIVAKSSGSVDGLIVEGAIKSNKITNSKICGNAYYQTIDSGSLTFLNGPSNPTCPDPLTPGTAFPNSPDPPAQTMPISDSNIQSWKNDATAGETITGNCGDNGVPGVCDILNNGTLSLGPKKINGNLVLTKKQNLIVTGTLYFTGRIDIDSSSGATMKCDAGIFGGTPAKSCIIIADGWIHIKNNATFQGSGTAGSYILMLTTLAGCNGGDQTAPCTHHNGAIDLHNNATGAIFYSNSSMVNLHNGVNVSELTAYKLQLDNNAVVTYEQGLANISFSSGPSGGWDINSWQETLPQ